MFRIELPDLVTDNLNIISVDWEISSKGRFTDDIILTKSKITDHNFIDIDLSLGNGDIYYVRYRYKFTGDKYTPWSRPIMVTEDSEGFQSGDTVISTPRVDINASEDNIPLGGFIINSSKYTLFTGYAEHKATDYAIEDLEGNVIWSRVNDGHNLLKIRVPKGILKIEKSYIIKVRYRADNGVLSADGKLVVNTVTNDNSYTSTVSPSDDHLNRDLESLLLSINTNMYNIISEVVSEEEI